MIGLALMAMAVATDNPTAPLRRQDHQDTIYVLRGPKAELEAFRTKVGDSWAAGTLVDGDPAKGFLRYWAYSNRTAAQSREFLMPAAMAGFEVSIEAYDEAKSFPVERGSLDRIATRCGARIDPFFITPLRSLAVVVPNGAPSEFRKCLSDGVKGVNPALPLWTARKS